MLCGSFLPSDLDAVAKLLLDPPQRLDFVEVRLDRLGQALPFGILAERRVRVIVACRHPRDGGEFVGSDAERLQILAGSVKAGADAVDLELPHAIERTLLGIPPDKLIVSHHDLAGTPEDGELDRIVRRAAGERPRWIKIAARAHDLADNLRIFALLTRHPNLSIAAFCMGEKGKAGRLLASRFGSKLDYVALESERPTAPGQYSHEEWLEAIPEGGLTQKTVLHGLLGKALSHSWSPRLQSVFFRAAGLDGVYAALPCDTLGEGLTFAEKLSFHGLNITIPYKEEAGRRATSLGMSARRAGAVNVLCRLPEAAVWKGFNTDGPAFLKILCKALGQDWPTQRRILILGAGGTALVLSHTLARAGVNVFVSGRSAEQTHKTAHSGRATPIPWDERQDFQGDLIVNATPVGTAPAIEESPIEETVFRHVSAAFDLVYNPPMTRFLLEARAAGCKIVPGTEMFVEQGARSFRLWTGRQAPLTDNEIRDHFPWLFGPGE